MFDVWTPSSNELLHILLINLSPPACYYVCFRGFTEPLMRDTCDTHIILLGNQNIKFSSKMMNYHQSPVPAQFDNSPMTAASWMSGCNKRVASSSAGATYGESYECGNQGNHSANQVSFQHNDRGHYKCLHNIQRWSLSSNYALRLWD